MWTCTSHFFQSTTQFSLTSPSNCPQTISHPRTCLIFSPTKTTCYICHHLHALHTFKTHLSQTSTDRTVFSHLHVTPLLCLQSISVAQTKHPINIQPTQFFVFNINHQGFCSRFSVAVCACINVSFLVDRKVLIKLKMHPSSRTCALFYSILQYTQCEQCVHTTRRSAL